MAGKVFQEKDKQYPARKKEDPADRSFAVLMAVLGSTSESIVEFIKSVCRERFETN
jgi:hypothetical protein